MAVPIIRNCSSCKLTFSDFNDLNHHSCAKVNFSYYHALFGTWAGGQLAPPIFGRSVNPIPTGGRAYYPHLLLLAPHFFHLPVSLRVVCTALLGIEALEFSRIIWVQRQIPLHSRIRWVVEFLTRK